MRLWLAVLLLAASASTMAATRVVSLAPSLSEIVVELDSADLLVGVLEGGDRPSILKDLPSVGRYGQLDMERLLSLKPDLLLLWPGSVGPVQREQLKRLGIATYIAEPHRLDQLITQIEDIATQLGRPERGVQRAAQLRERLETLRQRYRRDTPVSVFYQVWDRQLYTVGGGQIISDALAVCACFASKLAPTGSCSAADSVFTSDQIVGASLLAKAVGQSTALPTGLALREQARSHREL
jgi:vitamin B12 transport system substrate-binding protein